MPPPHLDGVFRAFGRERDAAAPDLWSDPSDGLLFLFHLHGFADLAAYAAGARSEAGDAFWVEVLEDWLSRCGRPRTGPAWHPYPLSGRVLASCAALSGGGWPGALADELAASLRWQLAFLRRSVEDDIGGNHVLRNACALVVGGACGSDLKAWRRGGRVLERELPRQVLPDGGHEERSPSYAREILGDLEDVVEVERRAGRMPPQAVLTAIRRMRRALHALAGPDGALPRLNDAWDGPPLAPSADTTVDLSESGWVVLRHSNDQAVFDVGPLCPPHLPPHAHADALSFVLWADGRPVVVDPGSGGYEPADRLWARATRSHSTVELDGEDQCIFWGTFRASRLPRVSRGPLDVRPEATLLTARHDGYSRLADPVAHVRTFCWLPGDGLVIVDRLRGRGTHDAVLTLPLAPAGAGPLRIAALDGRPLTQRQGRLAPAFGAYETGPVLEQRLRVWPGQRFGWALTRSEATVAIDGTRVEVRRPGLPPVSFDASD